jgi:hypothetical protein
LSVIFDDFNDFSFVGMNGREEEIVETASACRGTVAVSSWAGR